MDILTNASKMTEFEESISRNINTIVWIIAIVAVCVVVSFIKNCLDGALTICRCVWNVVTCKCLRRAWHYNECKDDY